MATIRRISAAGRRTRSAVSVFLLVLLCVPACQPPYLLDITQSTAFPGRGRNSVLEGTATVRDGEEVQVPYQKAFQSPPRLVLVEISQSWFKQIPYKLSDFNITQQQPTFFKIQNNHTEQTLGAWAVIKWRAEGVRLDVKAAGTSKREQLLARVERLHGNVVLDWRAAGVPVIGIDLHGTRVTDNDLELLNDLVTLRTLNLHKTSISDAGLENLSALTALQALFLNDTRITDAGLQHLQRLSGLKELGLCQTGVTDQGLPHLAHLTALQTLTLSGPGITDYGLKQLKALSNLKQLTLSHTAVTDAGIQELRTALPRIHVVR